MVCPRIPRIVANGDRQAPFGNWVALAMRGRGEAPRRYGENAAGQVSLAACVPAVPPAPSAQALRDHPASPFHSRRFARFADTLYWGPWCA